MQEAAPATAAEVRDLKRWSWFPITRVNAANILVLSVASIGPRPEAHDFLNAFALTP